MKQALSLLLVLLLLVSTGCAAQKITADPATETKAPETALAATAAPEPETTAAPEPETTEPPATETEAEVEEASTEEPSAEPETSEAVETSEAPEIEAAPEGLEVRYTQPSGFPVLVPFNTKMYADLNGDGIEESVCVSKLVYRPMYHGPMFRVELNGEDVSEILNEEGVEAAYPGRDYWYITDIYTQDNLLEIAIFDEGPSDDPTVNFFRYDGSKLYFIGNIPGWIAAEGAGNAYSMSFDHDGYIGSFMRLYVLQTWYSRVEYTISNRETLELVQQKLYYAMEETEVTAKCALTAYDLDANTYRIEAGSKLTLLGTDNDEWVLFRLESDGRELYLRLHNQWEVETPEGYVTPYDALDGLFSAD